MLKKQGSRLIADESTLLISLPKRTFLVKRDVKSLVEFVSYEIAVKVKYLEVHFISAKKLHSINKKFLNHDYETDIITFQYSRSKKNIEGEILISIDNAKENAEKYLVSFSEELLRLVVHGILHLAGYDDKSPEEKKKMMSKQEKLLNRFTMTIEKESLK